MDAPVDNELCLGPRLGPRASVRDANVLYSRMLRSSVKGGPTEPSTSAFDPILIGLSAIPPRLEFGGPAQAQCPCADRRSVTPRDGFRRATSSATVRWHVAAEFRRSGPIDRQNGVVSTHPNNPYWDQQADQPIVIYRQDWDEALADGFVTREHIALRLLGIVQYAYGVHDGDVVAYDEDGFVSALIAEGLPMSNGVKLEIYSGDHNPPHAHIKIPGVSRGRLTINLETFKIEQQLPDGWSKKGRQIEKEALANIAKLTEWWNKNRGPEARSLPTP
jgi:hypothetical protein